MDPGYLINGGSVARTPHKREDTPASDQLKAQLLGLRIGN